MTRSSKRYFACILISVAVVSLLVLVLKSSSLDRTNPGTLLYAVTFISMGGLVAREKGRWIGGWAVCSFLAPIFLLLLLLPYEEYRRMALNGAGESAGAMSGIEVKPVFPALAFLLFFVQPRIVIDATSEHELEWWKKRFFPLPSGQHTINISFNYLFGQHGKANLTLEVQENHIRRVLYFARPLMFVPPIIRVY